MRGQDHEIYVMGAAILTRGEVEAIVHTTRERMDAGEELAPSAIRAVRLEGRAVRVELDVDDDRLCADPFRVEASIDAMARDLSSSLGVIVYACTRDWDTGGQAVAAFEHGQQIGEAVHGGDSWPEIAWPPVWPLERLAAAVKDSALERAFLDDLARAEQEKRDELARAEQEERDHPFTWVRPTPRTLPPADPAAIDAIFGGLFGAVILAGFGGYVGSQVIGGDLGVVVGAALALLPGGVLGARLVRIVARARAVFVQR